MKWIKELFKTSKQETEVPIKTLETIDLCDDVLIEENGEIRKGWIWEITKRTILVLTHDKEIVSIRYQRPLTQSIIKDNNLILYLNDTEHI